MKHAALLLVLTALALGMFYYFSTPELTEERELQRADHQFDFNYQPPEGWVLWEGVSANMSTFVNLDDDVYDPYDVALMQEYLNHWSPAETDVLVFVRANTVDATSRDYMSVVKIAGIQADDPLRYDDVRMILYNKPKDLAIEDSSSDIHTRKLVEVAGTIGDYFRMSNPSEHDSVNLSLPYKGQTITFYKNFPKDMSDEEVLSVFTPFVERIPFATD